jgi:hypothetical protein
MSKTKLDNVVAVLDSNNFNNLRGVVSNAPYEQLNLHVTDQCYFFVYRPVNQFLTVSVWSNAQRSLEHETRID